MSTKPKRPRSTKQWERAMQEMADQDTEQRLAALAGKPRRGRPVSGRRGQ
jgi:hypothetical protein